MPMGRPNNVSVAGSGIGSSGGYNAAGAFSAGNNAAQKYQGAASINGAITMVPIALVAFAILYVIWAIVEQHERIKETVDPANIAFNIRNLAVIGLTAILGIVILKVGFTKLVAWGVPGAATVNQIIAAA